MAHTDDPLAAGVRTAHTWLNAVADGLGTDDRRFALRALRAWMHTVRDRIGVSNSAHVAAQLPMMLRGLWYEGWVPAHGPVRHGVAAFVEQFAESAHVERSQVVPIAGRITRALDGLFAPGELNQVFAVLSAPLDIALWGDFCLAGDDAAAARAPGGAVSPTNRLLAEQVTVLGQAVALLSRSLECFSALPPEQQRMAAAVQAAYRVLCAEGLVEGLSTETQR